MSRNATIIILNGTSSAGKSTLSKILQTMLTTPYLHVGIDTFIDIMPQKINKFDIPNQPTDGFWCKGISTPSGHHVDKIMLGKYAQHINHSYRSTVIHLLNEGHNIILDEVFLNGRKDFDSWQELITPFNSLIVGVQPPLDTIEQREKARGNRRHGTARSQYHIIHQDIPYDITIDNAKNSNYDCAKQIVEAIHNKMS